MDATQVVFSNYDMNINNRSLLKFAETAKDHFAFLELFGLHYTLVDSNCVQFEAETYAINVYHDIQSYEIGIELEFNRENANFYFSELLRLVGSKQAEAYRNYIAYSEETVEKGLTQLANLFKENIPGDLLNDKQLYNRLKLQRDIWTKEYAIDVQLELARKKLRIYWVKKDYQRVVQVLEPLLDHLSLTEKEKLAYAKKHCA